MLTPDTILRTAADLFNTTPAEITGPFRYNSIIPVRFAAMYVCYYDTDHSYPEVGAIFHRNHSSIMHGVSRAEHDKKIKDMVRQIRREIKQREGEEKMKGKMSYREMVLSGGRNG